MPPCHGRRNRSVFDDRALLALQGPKAEEALARLAPEVAAIRMDARVLAIGGSACLVTRSGYTGEDGFEISVAAAEAERLSRLLLDDPSVAPAGLRHRALRAGPAWCFYGADIDEQTTPREAALEPSAAGGTRAGGSGAGRDIARARCRSAAASGRLAVARSNARLAAAPVVAGRSASPEPRRRRSHPAASDLLRPVRSPWVMCRTRSRRLGQPCLPRYAATCRLVEVAARSFRTATSAPS